MNLSIAFDAIRIGDTIKCEDAFNGYVVGVVVDKTKGSVYRQGPRSSPFLLIGTQTDTFALLDRPNLGEGLTTEPRLGWVTTGYEFGDNGPTLAFAGQWKAYHDGIAGNYGHGYRRISGGYGKAANVSAFTPATAVPTEALELLRDRNLGGEGWSVTRFLAAVAAANRSSK